jgi:hypothetical protein
MRVHEMRNASCSLLDEPCFLVQLLRAKIPADITFRWTAVVNQERKSPAPQSGETLILPDGRRFVFAACDGGSRGWWFSATAQDGTSRLQGNLKLEWDGVARGWRPAGARATVALPRSLRRTQQPRLRQVD